MFRFCFILLVILSNTLFGQELLSLEEAIKIGLEKNYSVLISKNEQEIARLQNNSGNAGLSPTISLNGNYNTSNLNSYQVFNTGVVQDRSGAKSNGLSASVNADWIIFDGLRMFAVKKRLSMNQGLSELELRAQMETTVYDIISAYYNVVRVNELIKAANYDLVLYVERRKIAEVREQIGSDSKVELLISKSDENRARSVIVQFELELLRTKTQLNTLLNRPVDQDFKASDSIVLNYNPTIDELKKSVLTQNTSLRISRQNELIFDQSVKEARANSLPFLTFNGAYVFTKTQSQAGFLFSNRQDGLNLGLTGRWIIFNGGKNNKLVKERNILALNQRLITDQTRLQVDALVYINYQAFLLNKKILEFELMNYNDSREVQLISLERYKLGKTGLLETIVAQKNLEDAQLRYINALYNIKIAETDLLRVNGALVK